MCKYLPTRSSFNSKAQVSAEFLVMVGIAFAIAISFVLISQGQLRDFRNQREAAELEDLGLKLQKEVLIAASVEEGYSRVFEIPSSLGNVNYSVNLQNSTLTLESKNAFYLLKVPQSVGNFTKGTNKINNSGGVIHIN